MFNKEIDVAAIMKEIQQKAIQKRNESSGVKVIEFNKNELLNSKIVEISTELKRINEFIIGKYNYTREHEETAIKLPYNYNKSKLKQKIITFIRRCVRKLTKFIWVEQNEVNKSLNANIKALYESQIELTKSLIIINDIIINQNRQDDDIKQLKNRLI